MHSSSRGGLAGSSRLRSPLGTPDPPCHAPLLVAPCRRGQLPERRRRGCEDSSRAIPAPQLAAELGRILAEPGVTARGEGPRRDLAGEKLPYLGAEFLCRAR